MSQLPLDMDRSLHLEIRDRTFLLQGEHVHASIQKVSQLLTVRRFELKLKDASLLICCLKALEDVSALLSSASSKTPY